ncbi:hypothetical protein Dda_4673 [Drechslerella dactyloides]|uniref:Uncharacterized protein n=1 Tax=Drechslerella dactyloides TaxID=74499 RepID=A0AAD6IY48_DREDA|nr:hypothetical protein Dda_4673 [Drechslerella dactyloides]
MSFNRGDRNTSAPTASSSPGGGLGASRFASATQRNPFYRGPMDPRHRDPTAVVLETSTGSLAADPVARTFKSWHHIEDAGSKIIFHLDEINCLVNGVVRPKDGSIQSSEATVVQATAHLSISLDKVMLFDQGLELDNTDKGTVLQEGSAMRLTMEGNGQKGRAPALGIDILKAENVTPENIKPENVKPIGPVTPIRQPPTTSVPEKKRVEEPLRQTLFKNSQPTSGLPMLGQRSSQAQIISPATVAAVQELKEIKLPTRCVLITGLPHGFKVSKILELIKPTRNTLVIEIQLTKSNSTLFHFFTPEGAKDFITQFPNGNIEFEYVDPELGPMDYSPKAQLWGDFVAIKGTEMINQVRDHGATRYLKICGRNPTTIKEATSGGVWSLDKYREYLGATLYDGIVRRDNNGQEIAELEFLSIHACLFAHAKLRAMDGFGGAKFECLPDPFVKPK